MYYTYELWEILKDGKDQEIYQVVNCAVPDYIGKQVKVSAKSEEGKDFKSLVKPKGQGTGAENLITMYGCLVTARYKKVNKYIPIKFSEAVQKLEDFKSVYTRADNFPKDGYKRVSLYTDLSEINVGDLDDLMNKTYYIMEE